MNCVFTIVAKNYLSFALTLGDSLKLQSPELDFFIFIVDDLNGVPNELANKYRTVIVGESIVPDFKEMAFKYNVTEYSTAIKPFIFNHLFSSGSYSKIIYSDPDIYFYQSPNNIYSLLDNNFCVITPHIIDIETAHKSEATDQGLLFAGIYNLGFIALRKSNESTTLLNWWSNRLRNFCYGDKWDNLHTDQKWIDFVPSYFTTGVHISHNKGFNIAYWNIHERNLKLQDEMLMVNNDMPVTFLHFSGNNPLNPLNNKQCKNLDINNYSIWKDFIEQYAKYVLNNGFGELIKFPYTYNCFENGDTVSALHRRIFRRLQELKRTENFVNPFATIENTFYYLLSKNRLLVGKEKAIIDFKDEGESAVNNKLSKALIVLEFAKKMLGVKKYSTMMRAFQKLFSNENQTFLIKEEKQIFIDDYIKRISQ